MHTLRVLTIFLVVACVLCPAQQTEPAASSQTKTEPAKKDDKPQVRYNVLNVCSPDEIERQVLTTMMAKVPRKASFVPDFELTRGVSTMKDAKPARYLRLRRELPGEQTFASVLYSISTDAEAITETLVLKLRDQKENVSLSFDDSVTNTVAPSVLLSVDTSPTRIRVERTGKSAVVLARCESGHQEALEPLFKQAADLMSEWRRMLGLKGAFKNDMIWLTAGDKPEGDKSVSKPTTPKPQAKK